MQVLGQYIAEYLKLSQNTLESKVRKLLGKMVS